MSYIELVVIVSGYSFPELGCGIVGGVLVHFHLGGEREQCLARCGIFVEFGR